MELLFAGCNNTAYSSPKCSTVTTPLKKQNVSESHTHCFLLLILKLKTKVCHLNWTMTWCFLSVLNILNRHKIASGDWFIILETIRGIQNLKPEIVNDQPIMLNSRTSIFKLNLFDKTLTKCAATVTWLGYIVNLYSLVSLPFLLPSECLRVEIPVCLASLMSRFDSARWRTAANKINLVFTLMASL